MSILVSLVLPILCPVLDDQLTDVQGIRVRRETYLGMQCRMHELRNKERISVAAASKILANIVYEYKGRGLSMVSLFEGSQRSSCLGWH